MTEASSISPRIEKAYLVLQNVFDPEIPVLSVLDLGIIRSVSENAGILELDISPTYSGCPAMRVIEMSVRLALEEAGLSPIKINTVIHPPWTTDWMTEEGKEKLRSYGIAPPVNMKRIKGMMDDSKMVCCPRCGSKSTVCVSEFGSTACKAFYKCNDCLEPFDYFKCH